MHTRRVQKWIIGSLRSTPRTQFSAVPEKFVKLPNRFPKASKLYDIYSTGSDEAEVVYEYNHKLYYQALFSVSRVFYDFLGQLPETGKFWSAGVPATSCLEAAVAWAIATDIAIAPHILQEVGKYLPWLIPATPTGLTVRADPNDGTVLHLTWQDNANDETWFEVNNAARSRKAPAHSGTGTVTYTWTGLKPGSWICFKVRAANGFGDSGWVPKPGSGYNGSGYDCAFTSSPSPQPTAKQCVFLLPNQVNCTSSNPQITLEAENIGDTSGCTFSDQIIWGDGSQQTVKYPGANNQPEIVANHTYQQKGTFSITVNPTVLSGGCSSISASYKFTYS